MKLYSWISVLDPCADGHKTGSLESDAALVHLTTEPSMELRR
jgi:hypothetical protein